MNLKTYKEQPETELLIKGLDLVRRNVAPVCKTIQQAILDIILPVRIPTEPKTGEALESEVLACAHRFALELLCNDDAFEPEQFLLSGTLKDSYKKGLPPHAMVASHVREAIANGVIQRTPPRNGERIFYAVTTAGSSKKVSDRSHDLELIELNNLKIDRVHYLALNQKPFEKMCSFMSPPALAQLLTMFSEDTVIAHNRRRKDSGIASISSFMGGSELPRDPFKVCKSNKRKRPAFTKTKKKARKKAKGTMRSLFSYMK